MSNSRKKIAAEKAAAAGFDIMNLEVLTDQIHEEEVYLGKSRIQFFGMPQYWGNFHDKEATFWADRLGMSEGETREVLQSFIAKVPGQATDQQGCWGPSIATLLSTARRMGLDYWPIFCEEMDFSRYYHLGEAFFWVNPEYRDGKWTGGFNGMTRRRFYCWKLLRNLSHWGIYSRTLESIPFVVLKGMDKLGPRSFRIARAILLRAADGFWRNWDEAKSLISPEEFFQDLADYVRGIKDPVELWRHIPKGDFPAIIGGENEFWAESKVLRHLSKAHLYVLSKIQDREEKISLCEYKEQEVLWAIWRVREGEFSSEVEALKEVSRLDESRWSDPTLKISFNSYAGASAVPLIDDFFGRHYDLTVDGKTSQEVSAYSDQFRFFSETNEVLVDETDRVKVYYDPEKSEVIHKVKVFSGMYWYGDNKCFVEQFVFHQIGTSRSFHAHWGGKFGVKKAITAWRKQAKLEKANADLVEFLNGENGFMPLIRFVDSCNSGNCAAGTSSYMEKRGWSGRDWIPGFWLVPYLDYSLVKNTAMQVYWDLRDVKS